MRNKIYLGLVSCKHKKSTSQHSHEKHNVVNIKYNDYATYYFYSLCSCVLDFGPSLLMINEWLTFSTLSFISYLIMNLKRLICYLERAKHAWKLNSAHKCKQHIFINKLLLPSIISCCTSLHFLTAFDTILRSVHNLFP